MSSKHRRHHRRHRHPNPGNSPSSPTGRPDGVEAGRHPPGANRIVLWIAVAIVGATVVYAARGLWRAKKSATEATVSMAASSAASAPSDPNTPARTQAAAPSADGPRIQFASQVYDFGKTNGDSLVDCLFTFTNTGNARLEVTEVNSSCGCMAVGAWSRQVEPGQTGTIAVRYDSHHYTGRFAKSVFVTCNDAAQPKPILEITGMVWRPIEITPLNAVLNLNAESPSNSTAVRLISHLDDPLVLSELTTTSSAFAVELQTNQPGKEYQVNVKTVPPWPTNSQQAQITLKTSATNLPVITLSAFVNYQPIVMAIPFQVRLPALPLTNAFSGTVSVRNNGTNALAVSEPVVNGPGVDVQLKEIEPGRLILATLNFPAGFDVAAGENLELHLKSDHPLFPVIRVPIVQTPRPAP